MLGLMRTNSVVSQSLATSGRLASKQTSLTPLTSLAPRRWKSGGASKVATDSADGPVLSPNSINQAVVKTQYAVRGPLVLKAEEYRNILKTKPETLPFKEIIACNIGNPQELGQVPISFLRQVISLVEYPPLLEAVKTNKALQGLFPEDVVERASYLRSEIPGGVGAYTHSQGLAVVRKTVAEFIERRDGVKSDPEQIFLFDGASPAVQSCLKLVIRGPSDGVMIPIPQYPLYSASIPLFGGQQVNYYLNEEKGWGLSLNELEKAWNDAKNNGVIPRALVIINPGNPTGQVLLEENMREIIDFCKRRRVVLMADEVYQTNIYQPEKKPFHSFKKVLHHMGAQYSDVELISFHSISKGVIGECGQRGGYLELTNIHKEVHDQLYKLASISLCPNAVGQIIMSLVVNPPRPGQPSYELYKTETTAILESLKRRAVKLIDALNTLEGVSCNPAEGAMYAFAKITIPQKAVDHAKLLKVQPDFLYASELLGETGICIIPGSGFGQRDGTYHFRTTFLPHESKIDSVIELIKKFHKGFMARYQ
eukprot:TRINITY_DN1483_c0_g1_i1.p1 TRINITY_DN1483_c0_g1~~TRINITY_DN1483_c0_g1_i1.p1  ORF type:complete len:538 (+),score=125.19 TRINITY_DN1483_c0_g1_i1:111-1724(+)